MATPAVWTQIVPFTEEKPTLWPMVSKLHWIAAAGAAGFGTWWIASLSVRQGWLHILIEISIALLAMAGGALLAIAALNRNHRQFVETMAQAMDARDPYTAGHSSRVGDYCYAMARALGFSRRAAHTIRDAAELHDIGKIGVPDAVLQKRGPLTLDEI